MNSTAKTAAAKAIKECPQAKLHKGTGTCACGWTAPATEAPATEAPATEAPAITVAKLTASQRNGIRYLNGEAAPSVHANVIAKLAALGLVDRTVDGAILTEDGKRIAAELAPSAPAKADLTEAEIEAAKVAVKAATKPAPAKADAELEATISNAKTKIQAAQAAVKQAKSPAKATKPAPAAKPAKPADGKLDRDQKAALAGLLLGKAGDLMEFWTETIADDPNAATLQTIDRQQAGEQLAAWLKYLPGKFWDTRLPQA